jgi:hypothetical protein
VFKAKVALAATRSDRTARRHRQMGSPRPHRLDHTGIAARRSLRTVRWASRKYKPFKGHITSTWGCRARTSVAIQLCSPTGTSASIRALPRKIYEQGPCLCGRSACPTGSATQRFPSQVVSGKILAFAHTPQRHEIDWGFSIGTLPSVHAGSGVPWLADPAERRGSSSLSTCTACPTRCLRALGGGTPISPEAS